MTECEQRALGTCLSVHPIHEGPRDVALRGTTVSSMNDSLINQDNYHGIILLDVRHLCRSFFTERLLWCSDQ